MIGEGAGGASGTGDEEALASGGAGGEEGCAGGRGALHASSVAASSTKGGRNVPNGLSRKREATKLTPSI